MCCRGRPTDIYALGVCLFTFVYGRIPFSAPTVYQLFQVVQTEPLRFPDDPPVSEDLKDLLSKMLHKVGLCGSLPSPSDLCACAVWMVALRGGLAWGSALDNLGRAQVLSGTVWTQMKNC